MQCKVCFQEIVDYTNEQGETLTAPSWMTMHDSCKLCIYCQHEVGNDLIEKRIRNSRSNDVNEEGPITIYHDYCHSRKLEQDFAKTPVTITQGHLDMLNAANLMFRANVGLSVATNQKEAELMAHKFVHEMTLEEKFISLKRLEAVAAMWSIALSKQKDKIQIQLDERERIKHKEIQQAGQVLEYEKKRDKKRVAEAKAGLLTPEEKQREKAIASLMKLGLSREAAINTLGATKQ